MWLFEVAYLPIRAVAVMVFAVVEKFLLGMCIFVMQCPCARPVSLNVVDCGLLALWVENEHELIGFWAFCAWFWHLYHLCCLILAWNLAFLGRSAKECRDPGKIVGRLLIRARMCTGRVVEIGGINNSRTNAYQEPPHGSLFWWWPYKRWWGSVHISAQPRNQSD